MRCQSGLAKKALVSSAFFIAALLPWPGWTQVCGADHIDETVVIKKVVDGDTLRLTDGRNVRLIGINTPEIGYSDAVDEPLAVAARDTLQRMLMSNRQRGQSVELRYDAERKDRHGRLLAHVYINGQNVQQQLLAQGLAFAIAVPPNLWQSDCYHEVARRARLESQGVWSLAYYEPVDSARQPVKKAGFQRLHAVVTTIVHSDRAIWLNLQGQVSLRIGRKDWPHFDLGMIKQLRGKTIIVHGWLVHYRDRWQMALRHPLALDVPEATVRKD